MAASKIIDLDALAADDKIVRLGGQEYRLPGDLPVELWLRLQRQAAQTDSDDTGAQVQTLYEQLLELFRYGQPDLDSLPVGMTQLVRAIGVIYGGDEPEERPTRSRASAAGTRSSSAPRARKSSRS